MDDNWPARMTFFIMAGMLLGSCAAHAGRLVDQSRGEEARISECIRRAAAGRPWLEKTLWGLRDKEAGRIGSETANGDGSHDLGPMQINSWWLAPLAAVTKRPAKQIRFWLIRDPCFNVDAARWIFLGGLSVSRDYWMAIGIYHSPTGWRQRRYAYDVALRLKRRFGPAVFHGAIR